MAIFLDKLGNRVRSGSPDAVSTRKANTDNSTAIAIGSNNTQSGIITADSASNTVDNSRNTLNDIGSNTGLTSNNGDNVVSDRLSELFKQLSDTRNQLSDAQEKRKLAEDNLTDVELQTQLDQLGSSEEVNTGKENLAGGINAINTGGDTSEIDNPVLRAITDASINRISNIQAQFTRLDAFRQTMSDFSQAEVDDIQATAMRSVERQIAENDRVKRSMEFAGIIGGRAQFAPIVQDTIIHEIVQDGLDRIDVIEAEKNKAIRTARQAESEFNYTLFTDSVDLANELNTEIENSITSLKAEVRQAEKDEQDKMTFRQQQEERNALILAGELTDATPEQIQETAVANGIDFGLLTKAVNDAKFEKSTRDFTEKSNVLTLDQKRTSISKTRNDIRLANEKADEDDESTIPKDVEQGFRSVARLSKTESEAAWGDIQSFGLGDSVSLWLEGGMSKSQVKAMVSAHEQSQRVKDGEGALQPTNSENTLHAFIDKWKSGEESFSPKLAATQSEIFFKK